MAFDTNSQQRFRDMYVGTKGNSNVVGIFKNDHFYEYKLPFNE